MERLVLSLTHPAGSAPSGWALQAQTQVPAAPPNVGRTPGLSHSSAQGGGAPSEQAAPSLCTEPALRGLPSEGGLGEDTFLQPHQEGGRQQAPRLEGTQVGAESSTGLLLECWPFPRGPQHKAGGEEPGSLIGLVSLLKKLSSSLPLNPNILESFRKEHLEWGLPRP